MDHPSSYDLYIRARRHRSEGTARLLALAWQAAARIVRRIPIRTAGLKVPWPGKALRLPQPGREYLRLGASASALQAEPRA